MRVSISAAAVAFYRRPRSKKRRIRDKWFKRPENHGPCAYYMPQQQLWVAHPVLACKMEALKKSAEERQYGSVSNHPDEIRGW